MRYDNTTIRRQDRLLDEPRAKELLKTAEFGTLSMIDENGLPYGIPVNYVWDGKDSVSFHVIRMDAEPLGRWQVVDAPPADLQADEGQEQYPTGFPPLPGLDGAEMQVQQIT